MVPDEDQAMALPWASVMVIMVLLNEAFTCATPEAIFLRSRRRTRPVAMASLPIQNPFKPAVEAADQFGPSVKPWLFSCRQWPWPAPCGCGRWCGCAGRGPAAPCGDADPD